MALEERKIGSDQVVPGMYVCRLDRPWTDTLFPLQGFLVESADHVSVLQRLCREV